MVTILYPTAEPVERELPVQEQVSSFDHFVREHELAVFTFCYRMLGNARVAEAVAATVFLNTRSRFPAVSLKNLLAAACYHCRRQLQREDYSTDAAAPAMQNLFNRLPLAEREVLALRYGCQLSFAEIAAVVGSSSEAVRATLHRARRRTAGLPLQGLGPTT